MKVYFVGAGPGDPELLTVKAQRLLRQARCCIYAGSLVNPADARLAAGGRRAARFGRHDAGADHRRLFGRPADAASTWSACTRGEPAIYGAIGEQMDALDRLGIEYEVVPGISSFQAAAAALRVELTAPEIAQTVILTRTARPHAHAAGRRPVAPGAVAGDAVHLSLHGQDRRGGGDARRVTTGRTARRRWSITPRGPTKRSFAARWPTLAGRIAAAGIAKTAIFLVGWALRRPLPHASKLYDKTFGHGHRREVGP